MTSNHPWDSTGTRYIGLDDPRELCKQQEEERKKPRLNRPSGPERCFVVEVDKAKPRAMTSPQMSFELKHWDEPRTSLGVEWEASAKATSSIGFLDLSKEIRDMVYQAMCANLKREGIEWRKTAPKVTSKDDEGSADHVYLYPWLRGNRDEPDEPDGRPSVLADCSIMRTCRQIHAEFASVLYGSPIHLPAPDKGKNTISISPVYAGLVRAVLCGLAYSDCHDNPFVWWWYLSVATGLNKIFPNADVLRLGWYSQARAEDIPTLAAIGPEAWEVAVRQAKGAIKTVKSMSNTPLVVPHNLEVVKFYKQEREAYVAMSAPVTDAVVRVRAKKRQRKAGRIQAA